MKLLYAFELLLLLVIANGTPFMVHLLFGTRLDRPLDGNLVLSDGHPLFGPSKTIRGLLGAIIMTAGVAPLFGLTPVQGAAFGMLAMLGDLVSSFTKRRLGILPSRSAPLLDQLPEALLPLLAMQPVLSASMTEILLATALFLMSSLLISWLREPRRP
jgi:CDP-2,3-bis-(O-geranylgeranyl)-sn-glycerol synthase